MKYQTILLAAAVGLSAAVCAGQTSAFETGARARWISDRADGGVDVAWPMVGVGVAATLPKDERAVDPKIGNNDNPDWASDPITLSGRFLTYLAATNLAVREYAELKRAAEQEVEDGIPYLRSIPWIGQWLFGSTTKRKDKVDIVLFVTVGEIGAEGPRGAIGAPAGAMNVVNDYPRGFNETNEHERSQSNER